MPDCSQATVYVWPVPDLAEPASDDGATWERYERELRPLRAALEGLNVDPLTLEDTGSTFDGETAVETLEDGVRRLRVTQYEVPWGINYDPIEALFAAAAVCGVAWLAEDGGHYTWDPYVEWWHPGMDAHAISKSDQDGNVVLDLTAYAELRKRASDDGSGDDGTVDYLKLGRAVALHFIARDEALAWRPTAAEAVTS